MRLAPVHAGALSINCPGKTPARRTLSGYLHETEAIQLTPPRSNSSMRSSQDDLSLSRFWRPRYWPTWCLWLLLRCLAYLPFRWQITIGKRFGRFVKFVSRKKPKTALRNLEACFPDLTDAERVQLLNKHFEALGISLAEMAICRYEPIERVRELIRVEGRENLERAQQEGNGVILYAAHFTCLEIGLAILLDLSPRCSAMYTPHENSMVDMIVRQGRRRLVKESIPTDDVRALVRSLRNNATVVYLPDHVYAGSHSELLPFFGEPALTTTAVSKLAKLSGATVLAYFFRRLPDDSGYVVNIAPPLPNFPSDDPVHDTGRLVAQLEDYIRLAPEQYAWTYRRFKDRPEPYYHFY